MSNLSEFDKQAGQYLKFRPSYPDELIQYLVGLCPERGLAWDVATGNGQAAVLLSPHFDQVVASDLSHEQVSRGDWRSNITYFQALAHDSRLESGIVDLVTVATALHWFEFKKFFNEVRRVTKPKGIFAAWSYAWHRTDHQEIDRIFIKIGQEILAPFWSPQPKLIWSGYSDIPFDFPLLHTPEFSSTVTWNLSEFLGYLSTWSASQKYLDQIGVHPAETVMGELRAAWGPPEKTYKFVSPLVLKVGRVHDGA